METEVARGLVKKIVVAAGAGIAGINMGNLEDWRTGIAAADKLTVPMMGASMFMGLMDTTITQKKPGGAFPYTGHLQAQARKAGDPRPGFYAIRLVQAQIAGFTAIERLDPAELSPADQKAATGVWAYRLERPAGPVWVLWYDDGALYLPGQVPPSLAIRLPFGTARARLTWVPTSRNESQPRSETAEAGKALSIELDATPVFVEEVR